MTTVVISQPMLFPWPGFFELISSADIYVHLDDVQFSKGSFLNRIQIKHPSGIKWMTIPLVNRGSMQSICDLRAVDSDWRQRHYDFVAQSLRVAPYFNEAAKLLHHVYAHEDLITLLTASIEEPMRTMALRSPSRWLYSSAMGIKGSSWQRVLAIVQSVGGTRYVTAHGAASYLNHEAFENAGITVEYANYSKRPYPQLHGPFSPFVSILDLIANVGPSAGEVLDTATIPWRRFLAERASPT
jgi:hypothetical protein